MKKVILTIATAFLTFSMNAQITIKVEPNHEVVWQGTKLSSVPNLTALEFNGDTSYVIYYKNGEYTHIVDIDFLDLGDKETAIQFFGILKEVSAGANGNKATLEIGGETWRITKYSWTVQVYRSGSFFYLTAKQVDAILETLSK